jgi:hypothetical protein
MLRHGCHHQCIFSVKGLACHKASAFAAAPLRRDRLRRRGELDVGLPGTLACLASEVWCGSGDLNPDGIATASPSSWCVCQFRHFRVAVRVGGLCLLFCRRWCWCRWRRCRWCRCRRSRLRGGRRRRRRAAEDRPGPAPLTEHRQGQRKEHEQHRRNRGRLGQQRRARSRAERRLAAAAAKCAGDITTAPLLQKNDHREHETHEHVGCN